jgi:hypothetical protein
MSYTNIHEYIQTIWSIFYIIKDKAKLQQDKKLEMLSLVIFNYISFMSKTNNIKFKDLKKDKVINLIPFFEYVTFHNIQFYDLTKITEQDLDVTSKNDLEKYILSQIYYFSQKI